MRAQGFFRLVPLLVLLIMLSGAVGAVTLVGASAQGDGFHSQVYATRTEPLKQAKALYVGHEAVAQFDEIPDWAREAASNMRVLQLRASTGMYISSGLCCLQGRLGSTTPCGDPRSMCSDPYGLDNWIRDNWHFVHYHDICEPHPYSDRQKADCFAEAVAAYHNRYDVFSMKFCFTGFCKEYCDLPCGDHCDVSDTWEYYKSTIEQLEAAYPDKTFVWWTKPLRVSWDYCQDVQEFNTLVRDYCQANGKILYDIADIESHDENGNPCYGGCESMCSECNPGGGGHPGEWLCKIRLAKAYWVLMAKIAGWTLACDLPGDVNCDCAVDMADIMLVANRWSSSVGDDDYNPAYDLDGDGDIDIVDIMLVAVHWGEICEG